jgi:RHS repeat-associated protein
VELDSAGIPKAVNLFGADGLVARREKVGAAWVTTGYAFDPQGSVSLCLNASGSQVGAEEAYDGYGKQLLPTNAGQQGNGSPWGYNAQSGYYTDRETGLILCTYRYYDPEEGRFINRDPIGYEGGSNLYAYTDGNSTNDVDPDGTSGNKAANAASGFFDSLTFGLTGLGRNWLLRQLDLQDYDVVDENSGAYVTGEVVEFGVEVVATAGSAALKKAAVKVTQKASRKAAEEIWARNGTKKLIKELTEVTGKAHTPHHRIPLSGHPIHLTGGRVVKTLFPTRDLPRGCTVGN